jgi:hypothetical protein
MPSELSDRPLLPLNPPRRVLLLRRDSSISSTSESTLDARRGLSDSLLLEPKLVGFERLLLVPEPPVLLELPVLRLLLEPDWERCRDSLSSSPCGLLPRIPLELSDSSLRFLSWLLLLRSLSRLAICAFLRVN